MERRETASARKMCVNIYYKGDITESSPPGVMWLRERTSRVWLNADP